MSRIRFELHYRAAKWTERLQMFVAWRCPRWLVKWTLVRAYAQAWHDAGDKTPDELTYGEVYDAVKAL